MRPSARHPLDRAFRGAVLLLAGIFAAPFAHAAIDWIGDAALSRDAFDGVAHSSRGLLLAVGLVLALALGVRQLWRALCGENAQAARASLEQLVAVPLWRAIAFVFPVALVGVAVMEALDLCAAGRAVDDPADLLSGSIPFGIGMTLGCAMLVALAVRCVASLAAAACEVIVAALACRTRGRLAPRPMTHRLDGVWAPRRSARPVRCGGMRAPPFIAWG